MAPTPFPRNLMHVGTAQPLTLAAPLTVPPTGDITLTVEGDATAKGWLAVPSGSGIVVTVGRGEAYESKYVVSSITVGPSSSTLTVNSVDRNYDGTLPQNAPAGATVEHTISAAEMTSVTEHMRSRQGHGSDGDLVDVNSPQTLANKTFTGPTVVNATSGATDLHLASGGVNRWTLRRWTNGDLHIQRRDAAGNDQGAALVVDADTGRVWAGRETQGGDANATLATKGYVDTAGKFQPFTPVLAAASLNPTATPVAAECRYTRIGDLVTGKAQFTITAAGAGQYRMPLPVTPRASAVAARRIGTLQFYWTEPPGLGGLTRAEHYFLEQANGQSYCNAIYIQGASVNALSHMGPAAVLSGGSTNVTIVYDFTYEAA